LAEFNRTYIESVLEEAKTIGTLCQKTIGGPDGAGVHMSTADVARDMLRILDAYALSDDGKRVKDPEMLNYWGFSYGTFLGETFASMFPDRVGRVALDGVLDPDDFRSGLTRKSVTFADEVWATFFIYCNAAGPQLCAISTGTSPMDIYKRVEKSFLQFNSSYAYSQNWANASLVDEGLNIIRVALEVSVYTPIDYFPLIPQFVLDMEAFVQNATENNLQTWQIDWSNGLKKIAIGNSTTLPTVIDIPDFNFLYQATVNEVAVWASDDGGVSYNLTLEQLQPWIEDLEGQSVLTAMVWVLVRVWKTVWPIFGLHRYTGKLLILCLSS
jgi:pimeloyl-ACP methyl ester carboxylesterase